MKKKVLLIVFLTISVISNAQIISKTYYNNKYLNKEVPLKRAKFVEVVTKNTDESITKAVINLKNEEVVRSQTHKGDEPVGNWVIMTGKGSKPLDYNFPLIYSNEKCGEGQVIKGIHNYFIDDDSLSYKAPTMEPSGMTYYQFIGKNLIYPSGALRNNIQGVVVLGYTLTKEGEIKDIHVKQGQHILLDKEAVRVVRELKLSSPPMLNGESKDICVEMPLTFKLQ